MSRCTAISKLVNLQKGNTVFTCSQPFQKQVQRALHKIMASAPSTSWQTEGKTQKQCWASRITEDGDCSHEIKRRLLLRRKATANLDNVLKRSTSLCRQSSVQSKLWFFQWSCTDVRVRPLKNVEHRRTDTFKLWCWRRLLRAPWTARRANQSILKEINPDYALEVLLLKLKLQYFGPNAKS